MSTALFINAHPDDGSFGIAADLLAGADGTR